MLLGILALVTIVAMVLLAYYLRRVTDGPSCPRCGAMTRRVPGESLRWPIVWLDRWTVERICPVCGWSGRQRHRGETEPVRRGDDPRSAA